MAFVSYHYNVLGKDILDWYIWPINGLCVYFPMTLVGLGLTQIGWPFVWLVLLAQGLLVLLVAHTLVFIAAASIQALLSQIKQFNAAHLSPPPKWRVGVPVKCGIAVALVPAALAAPISIWGGLVFNNQLMVLGIALWLLPVVVSLSLAVIVHLVQKYMWITRSH